MSNYQAAHTYKKEEMVELVKELKGKKAGFAVCDEDEYVYSLIRYNEFLDISSLIPGSFIFRMNTVADDYEGTTETLAWVNKTAPVNYDRTTHNSTTALNTYSDWLKPEYIVTDQYGRLCSLHQLGLTKTGKSFDLNRYRFNEVSH